MFSFLTRRFSWVLIRNLEEDIINAKKKTYLQILHYVLTKNAELQKQYYLRKFLNSIEVPNEYTGDEEINQLLEELRQNQGEFKSTYEMVDELRDNVPDVVALKNDIKQIEQSRLQLKGNISIFESEYKKNDKFKAIFTITSQLRQEQEEDTLIEKKLEKQQYELDEMEDRLYIMKQHINESRKNLNPDVTASEMLINLRNNRNNNREAVEHMERVDLIDRRNRAMELESILSLPDISNDDIYQMTNERNHMQKECERLEAKLKISKSNTPEVEVFKENARKVFAAKEQARQQIEKVDTDCVK